MDMQKLVKQYVKIVSDTHFESGVNIIKERLKISEEEATTFSKSYELAEIKAIRDRFNNKKNDAKESFKFKDFEEFYYWFKAQNDKCYYCGSTQDMLNGVFDSKKIESKKPSFTATLQIDKKDPDNGYKADNCVLACVLCNNAKSDMINDENFKNYFGEAIGKFVADLYNGVITNK